MKSTSPVLLFTCEHAVNYIPNEYKALFQPHQDLLQTHSGIDWGAKTVAEHLSKAFSAPLIMATVSRLLVDCNRSFNHKQCFTSVSSQLSKEEKAEVGQKYYWPYRNEVIEAIRAESKKGRQVLHLSIHSFTPVMHDIPRNTDLGLLYDPRRSVEKDFAGRWQQQFKKNSNEWRMRLNYPYKGISDGFTTFLRKQFEESQYIGVEVECNQKIASNAKALQSVSQALEVSLRSVLDVL